MCTFITLVLASGEIERVNAILATLDRRGHSRRVERAVTPATGRVLTAGEREYVFAGRTCDCGTFLGHALQTGADAEAMRAADTARYRRKGWSDVQIARAMANKEQSRGRPARNAPNEDAAYWIALMATLGEGLGLKRLGLMHRFEGRSPASGSDAVTRRDAGPLADAAAILAAMPEGVIHDFRIGAQRR